MLLAAISCQGQICNPKWSQQSIWDSLCNTQIGDDESQVEMDLHGRYPINPKPCTLLTQEEEVKPAWFCEMKEYLDSMDLTLITSPDQLYNAVETGFHLSSKPPKVKAAKGSKHVNNVPATQSRASRYLCVVLRVATTLGHLSFSPTTGDLLLISWLASQRQRLIFRQMDG